MMGGQTERWVGYWLPRMRETNLVDRRRTRWIPDEQSESVCQPAMQRIKEAPCHAQHVACPLPAWAAATPDTLSKALMYSRTASLPSARVVKGESEGRLAENWPPREVIRKHKLKKPIPSTKILKGEKIRQTNQHQSWRN